MRYVHRLLSLLLVAAVVTVVSAAALSHLGPLLGIHFVPVRAASMAPDLPVGSLVVATRVTPDAVQPGDVVSLRLPNDVDLTHRVTRVAEQNGERFFETKGDANAAGDPAMTSATRLIGKAGPSVPSLGYLFALLAIPTGVISVLSVICMLLTAIWLLEEVEADDGSEEETGAGTSPAWAALTRSDRAG